jgi:hypothetical protein
MVRPIDEIFPALANGGFRVTSPVNQRYNCIAHAAGDLKIWWWPFPADVAEVYWPAGVTRAETLPAFRAAFATLGFTECKGEDVEPGFEKIAIFTNTEGVPLHASRQQADGRWTSKLGEREDIEHALRDLEGEVYGTVALLMARPIVP